MYFTCLNEPVITLNDIGNPGFNLFGMPMNDSLFDFSTKLGLLADFSSLIPVDVSTN